MTNEFIKLYSIYDDFGNLQYIDEYGIEYIKFGSTQRSLLSSDADGVINAGISLESALVSIGVAVFLIVLGGITSGLNVSLLGLDTKKLTILEYLADKESNENEKKMIESVRPLIEDHHLLLTTLIVANAVCIQYIYLYLDV